MQDGCPFAFPSKALTQAETRYANIEREMLVVVYGCERFHNYLFGHKFTVESDHKPLAASHLKHLNAAPPRLRRMLLRLQQYDIDIVYTPGKEIPVADALSRLSQDDKYPIEDLEIMVLEVSTQFSSTILESIRVATDEDS